MVLIHGWAMSTDLAYDDAHVEVVCRLRVVVRQDLLIRTSV